MNIKHTPGPWFAHHRQISSLTSTHGCTIANCNSAARGISDDEAEANSILIALAPEMLEALRECITEDDAPGMQPGLGRQRRRLHAINDIARAALAKLEGGQQ